MQEKKNMAIDYVGYFSTWVLFLSSMDPNILQGINVIEKLSNNTRTV